MSEQMCAHLHVEYHTLKNLDGSTHGWWQCDDCETKFVPESQLTEYKHHFEPQMIRIRLHRQAQKEQEKTYTVTDAKS